MTLQKNNRFSLLFSLPIEIIYQIICEWISPKDLHLLIISTNNKKYMNILNKIITTETFSLAGIKSSHNDYSLPTFNWLMKHNFKLRGVDIMEIGKEFISYFINEKEILLENEKNNITNNENNYESEEDDDFSDDDDDERELAHLEEINRQKRIKEEEMIKKFNLFDKLMTKNLDFFIGDFSDTKSSLLSLNVLYSLDSLQNLNLNHRLGISNEDFERIVTISKLKKFENLESLSLNCLGLCTMKLSELWIELTKLKKLELYSLLKYDDLVIKNIIKYCKELKELKIRDGYGIKSETFNMLSKELPNITTLHLENSANLKDSDVISFINQRKNKIVSLKLINCSQLTDKILVEIALNSNESIEEIDISYCSKVADYGILKALYCCSKIKSFKANFCNNLNVKHLDRIIKVSKERSINFEAIQDTVISTCSTPKKCKSIDLSNSFSNYII